MQPTFSDLIRSVDDKLALLKTARHELVGLGNMGLEGVSGVRLESPDTILLTAANDIALFQRNRARLEASGWALEETSRLRLGRLGQPAGLPVTFRKGQILLIYQMQRDGDWLYHLMEAPVTDEMFLVPN